MRKRRERQNTRKFSPYFNPFTIHDTLGSSISAVLAIPSHRLSSPIIYFAIRFRLVCATVTQKWPLHRKNFIRLRLLGMFKNDAQTFAVSTSTLTTSLSLDPRRRIMCQRKMKSRIRAYRVNESRFRHDTAWNFKSSSDAQSREHSVARNNYSRVMSKNMPRIVTCRHRNNELRNYVEWTFYRAKTWWIFFDGNILVARRVIVVIARCRWRRSKKNPVE